MKSVSTFVIAFLIIGFFFLALPEKGYSQLGCCVDNNLCVGCEIDCSTSEPFCTSKGGAFEEGGVCVNPGGGEICGGFLENPTGCCVTEQGNCFDDETFNQCNINIAGGEIWLPGRSCFEVPECAAPAVVSAVPTLTQWSLIAVAVVLGVISFIVIRRKKASS